MITFKRIRNCFLGVLASLCVPSIKGADVLIDVPIITIENLEIYLGDTVIWQAGSSGQTVSLTGEWNSGPLEAGDRFSFTFNKPGRYFYQYSSSSVASVSVRPLSGPRPAISIITPPDKFYIHPYLFSSTIFLQAVVTNEAEAKAVNFFRDGTLIGTVTAPPYTLLATNIPAGTFEFTATFMQGDNETNESPPIRLTMFEPFGMGGAYLFNPTRLPGGQFAFN